MISLIRFFAREIQNDEIVSFLVTKFKRGIYDNWGMKMKVLLGANDIKEVVNNDYEDLSVKLALSFAQNDRLKIFKKNSHKKALSLVN